MMVVVMVRVRVRGVLSTAVLLHLSKNETEQIRRPWQIFCPGTIADFFNPYHR
jgi:hypothetical protein